MGRAVLLLWSGCVSQAQQRATEGRESRGPMYHHRVRPLSVVKERASLWAKQVVWRLQFGDADGQHPTTELGWLYWHWSWTGQATGSAAADGVSKSETERAAGRAAEDESGLAWQTYHASRSRSRTCFRPKRPSEDGLWPCAAGPVLLAWGV